MSLIRKIPYIEMALSSLNTQELEDVEYLFNNGGSNYPATFNDLPEDTIAAVYFDLQNGKEPKTAILIQGDKDCLICYGKHQEVEIIDLDFENNTFAKVDEYCTIEELRRIVGDFVYTRESEEQDRVTATDISYNNGLTLLHDGIEISGQENKVKIKTINGQSIIGTGNVETSNLYALTAHAQLTGSDIQITCDEEMTKHSLIALEIETDGVHYGAEFIAYPYNASQCLVAFRMVIGGQFKDGYAYVGDDLKLKIIISNASYSGNFSVVVLAHDFNI